MRSSLAFLLVPAALLLAGCNFTLAEDITPPPDYVPPSPMPTLGALHPAAPPQVQNGATIFAERCAPCHGATGLGDGPQSMQLPVTVPGIGLAEVARKAAPAEWFKTVTQGNLDRFMPPFSSALTDAERWDVVMYAMSLHTSAAQIERGQELVEAGCAACADVFGDLARMAALSDAQVVQMIRAGDGDIPAFAADFSDEDAFAAATYLRSLTFGTDGETSVAVATAATAETPAAEGTPAPTADGSIPGTATITGTIEGAAGQVAGLEVTLHGFDHGTDQSSGPQEVLTLTTTAAADGSYSFDNVAMADNRIFLAEAEFSGITYRTDFQTAGTDSTTITLPPLTLYEQSDDTNLLTVDQIHIYTDFATPGTVQVLEIFAFSNNTERAIVISTDGATIPFIRLPAGAVNQGYEAGQGSEAFVTAKEGLAVLPSDQPYSIIAFFNLPFEKTLEFSQPMAIDSPRILLLVPDGVKVAGEQLTYEGAQVFQENSYQEHSATGLRAGETLAFTVSGRPKTSSATGVDLQHGWLIGGAALGLGLVLAGVYLYVRDRRSHKTDEGGAEFENTDEVLDAILALDDLRRAGRLPDEAYQRRRNELKDILRKLS